MIRKLKDGRYRLYSRKKNPKTGKRRNLGTFSSRAAAEKHERAVQYFKHGSQRTNHIAIVPRLLAPSYRWIVDGGDGDSMRG